MRRYLIPAITLCLMLSLQVASSAEDLLIKLDGISPDMRSKKLLDNWGFPSKRERKMKEEELWFYPNKNTPDPIDGIVVHIVKNKVRSWKLVDNMYAEMDVWGKGAGAQP